MLHQHFRKWAKLRVSGNFPWPHRGDLYINSYRGVRVLIGLSTTCVCVDMCSNLLFFWCSVHQDDPIMIYTDGSGYKNQIGATAVMYQNGAITNVIRYHLGLDMEHTVFEGELVGILLGLHLAQQVEGCRPTINISLNIQVALQAIQAQRSQPA